MSKNEINKSEEKQLENDQFNAKVYDDIRAALADARTRVVAAVNTAMVGVYHEIGRQITDAIGERAEYGQNLFAYLSERLTAEFGKGFTVRNLQHMRQFYTTFPNTHTLRAELSWSHYRALMRVEEPKRRDFYLNEAADSGWTSRQLARQINSFYYERLLATQKESRPEIADEIFRLEPVKDADYILKDPYILEFLDLKENVKYSESELEQCLIDKLQEFLLELGKGFSFVSRQKRITTEGGNHYYIDLVFYNYILKCFVVIDLKTTDLTYQDIGQIDFYTRLFDDTVKGDDDNPTIGIVLCSSKDETIVKYSVLSDKDNLYAAKYSTFLPTEKELSAELERQRELVERQIEEREGDTCEANTVTKPLVTKS
jgi:predicted nuclease of restriction endonuclease-like (RecB) superfamily